MNIEQKKKLTFGDLITAACQVRGSGSGRKDGVIGDQRAPGGISRAAAFFDFFREGKVRMNKANGPVDQIKMGLGIALLAALMGCVGYVEGGYGGAVLVPGPDIYVFGGGYERGHVVHEYSHRGVVSRAVAHPVGGGHERKR